ncbi:MAG: helix-turn-helix domain-containing protein [Nakamurella sp.]
MDTTVSSDGRHKRGRRSRSLITAAASKLFLERGFAATTVSAIAEEAGLSEPTVYYAFGSKEAVLVRALNIAIAGDEEEVATLDREWTSVVISEPDAAHQVQLMVAGAGDILIRAAPLLRVLQNSSGLSQELAATWSENGHQRREVQSRFVTALAEKGPLASGTSSEQATDLCTMYLGPEVYSALVHDLGWSHDAWATFVTSALQRCLLPD